MYARILALCLLGSVACQLQAQHPLGWKQTTVHLPWATDSIEAIGLPHALHRVGPRQYRGYLPRECWLSYRSVDEISGTKTAFARQGMILVDGEKELYIRRAIYTLRVSRKPNGPSKLAVLDLDALMSRRRSRPEDILRQLRVASIDCLVLSAFYPLSPDVVRTLAKLKPRSLLITGFINNKHDDLIRRFSRVEALQTRFYQRQSSWLGRLPELRTLSLCSEQELQPGQLELGKLRELRFLHIKRDKTGFKTLRPVEKFRDLEGLHLQIKSNQAYAPLDVAKLRRLNSIDFEGGGLHPIVFQNLPKNQLVHLGTDGKYDDAKWMSALKQLRSLRCRFPYNIDVPDNSPVRNVLHLKTGYTRAEILAAFPKLISLDWSPPINYESPLPSPGKPKGPRDLSFPALKRLRVSVASALREGNWKLPQLERLSLGNSHKFDHTFPLPAMPKLRALHIHRLNGLKNLSGFPTTISELHVSSCEQLEDYSAFQAFRDLTAFSGFVPKQAVPDIAKAQGLKLLELTISYGADASPIGGLRNLERLRIAGNHWQNLDSLGQCQAIRHLHLAHAGTVKPRFAAQLRSLRTVRFPPRTLQGHDAVRKLLSRRSVAAD